MLCQPVSCFLLRNLPSLLPEERFQAVDLAGAGPAQPRPSRERGGASQEGDAGSRGAHRLPAGVSGQARWPWLATKRPAGRLGVYQSAAAVLGELSRVPTQSSTFLAGPALGILEVPVMLRCPWLQLWLLLWSQACLLASFHQPTSRLAAFRPPDLVWENPGVHTRYDVVPAYSPA